MFRKYLLFYKNTNRVDYFIVIKLMLLNSKKFLNTRHDIMEVLIKRLTSLNIKNGKFIFSGWTSIIVDIDDKHIVKFPRNDESLNWLMNEKNIINVLKQSISLSFPARKFYDGISPFFLHKKLKGLLLDEQQLSKGTKSQKEKFLMSVAFFFNQIHSIPIEKLSSLIPTLIKIPQESDIIPNFKKNFSVNDVNKAIGLIKQAQKIKPKDSDYVVGYFDFHGGNIVANKKTYKLRGIFDFDEVAIRDYHFEFREVLLRYDEKYVLELIRFYESISSRKVDINKVWLYHIVWYMWEYSKMVSNPDKIACIKDVDIDFHKDKIKQILDTKYG